MEETSYSEFLKFHRRRRQCCRGGIQLVPLGLVIAALGSGLLTVLLLWHWDTARSLKQLEETAARMVRTHNIYPLRSPYMGMVHGAMNCYYFGEGTKKWIQARYACSKLQGRWLVNIHSQEEQPCPAPRDFLTKHSIRRGSWIGLRDLDIEGEFIWMDNNPLDYSHWQPGEPNDVGQGENCVMMQGSGRWNDAFCGSYLNGRVCDRWPRAERLPANSALGPLAVTTALPSSAQSFHCENLCPPAWRPEAPSSPGSPAFQGPAGDTSDPSMLPPSPPRHLLAPEDRDFWLRCLATQSYSLFQAFFLLHESLLIFYREPQTLDPAFAAPELSTPSEIQLPRYHSLWLYIL
ncbi:LOW QUALITY PROTEIN: low affinity immunoglobulin epsilon Fc receptor [Physeter macrocephalus]|uniref:LOW QUALITY PROTEIN: low affinity immunoglobulin epsilon Fc receptor n=1 Tax=Physeter macrocephalus TaxID=9755 RepID=UPI000CEB1A52|nr:LOW QUALITY PROTEIN: low affinity immunoglobulin epsilon Fc receptor [Physeter catodon]|eukprot:XP_023990133.1 LOW QUALITY PROTEIN: low affinity immunoglobulin epsilon Fc receptor [Physeter catodon]